MYDIPVITELNYNIEYNSPLYAEVRSVSDMPELWNSIKAISVNDTISSGNIEIVSNDDFDEAFVQAEFYEDDFDLAPLSDDLVLIYD